MRLEETLGHSLNARVGVWGDPYAGRKVATQVTMVGRTMRSLASEVKHDLRALFSRNHETDRVPWSIRWQSQALQGITKIAAILEMAQLRKRTLVSRCGAMALPPGPQRQAGRMRPRTILGKLHGIEEGARHDLLLRDSSESGNGIR
jgi:hypothetical protein